VTGNSLDSGADSGIVFRESKRHPGAIPGKWFVLPFVLLLLVLGVLMFAVAVRFQTIMSRLEEVRSLWPNASQELGNRYERLDSSFADSSVTNEVKVDWENGRREFKSSSQFDKQSIASSAIESQIHSALETANRNESDFNLPNTTKLREAETRRRDAQGDFIGWLTVKTLRLKLPPIYNPLAKNR